MVPEPHFQAMTFQPTSPRGGRPSRGRGRGLRVDDFNPRPHAGDDSASAIIPANSWDFNPRPHAGDDAAKAACAQGLTISTHVPTRGTTTVNHAHLDLIGISTHVPTRGTTRVTTCFAPHHGQFQPTSPRGGRRSCAVSCAGRFRISTHVPTRGTTHQRLSRICRAKISTHVPTRGTTGVRVYNPGTITGFQPTSPRGGRPLSAMSSPRSIEISTHVPTRGTT